MYEAFTEWLDQIYWEGYAEMLAIENPQDYKAQYNEFSNNHNSKSNEKRGRLFNGNRVRRFRASKHLRHRP